MEFDADEYYVRANDIRQCPHSRVRIFWATYHWSPSAEKIVLYRTSEYFLTAARPRIKKPIPVRPPDAFDCGFVEVIAQSDRPALATIPAAVQNSQSYEQFWLDKFHLVLYDRWGMGTVAEMKNGTCPRTTTPTPTP